MLVDITVKITPKMIKDAQGNEKTTLLGHLGTHFDVMDREFPLAYVERKAIVFDVSKAADRDITASDIQTDKIEAGMFVAFYTGFIETEGYGTRKYFTEHPQLSNELIDTLLSYNISIIGVDFAGVRRGKEHTAKDQYCADRNVFIIENLCSLSTILQNKPYAEFVANTYPVNYSDMTGLPCRVVAKVI
jgi:Predicted metal-dependent hydrolase